MTMNANGWIVLAAIGEVALIGALVLVLPRVSRRGLLFGAYVGEAAWGGEDARRLVRTWQWMTLAQVAASVAAIAGFGAAGHAVTGLVVGASLLLVGVNAGYFWAHFRARRLAPRHAGAGSIAAAPLAAESGRETTLPWIVTVASAVVGLAVIGETWARWSEIPQRVPMHFGASGAPDAWGAKGFATMMTLPIMTLLMPPLLGVVAVLTARAKRAVRRGGGASVAAQARFRRATVRLLSAIAILASAMLGLVSHGALQVALGRAAALPAIALPLGIAMGVVALGGALWLTYRHGQGGARIEAADDSAPLTDGLADDRFWKWGIFYVNPDDPSLMVEKRFGIGYTLNFAHRGATVFMVVLVAFIVLMTALSIAAVAGS